MMKALRRDSVELSYVYGGALLVVIFFALAAFPLDVSKFGLIVPGNNKEEAAFFNASPFADVKVQAEAYVVYDLVGKKVIAQKNGDVPLPLASITKVMTAYTALSHFDKDTKITIRPEHIDGGYDLGLVRGQVWTLQELLRYTLVFSSNDGAYAIADTLGGKKSFMERMNTDATLLGLSFTFTDPAGLDDATGVLGGKGTAENVAKLFGLMRAKYPDVLEATTKTRLTVTAGGERLSGIPNTNQEIEKLFGAEASKTGFTDLAGGNLGVVVDIALGHPVAIVVLGSTKEGRFVDTQKLYDALLQSLK